MRRHRVQLYVDSVAVGSPVDAQRCDVPRFYGSDSGGGQLGLGNPDGSGRNERLGVPRGRSAAPLAPAIQGPIFPGATTVTVNNCLTAAHATASAVNVYTYDDPTIPRHPGGHRGGRDRDGGRDVSALGSLKLVTATQVVNGGESPDSAPVYVAVRADDLRAPAQGDASVRVQDVSTSTTLVTVAVNGTTPFTAARAQAIPGWMCRSAVWLWATR